MRAVVQPLRGPRFSLSGMLRVVSAASGEEVHAYDKAQFDAMVADSGATVGALKRHLAVKHFERKYSRFQLRILREGNPEELEDDEIIVLPMDLQLMLLSHHLPPDAERDERFLKSCSDGLVDEVEQGLKGLQDPNVAKKEMKDLNGTRKAIFFSGLTFAMWQGHLDVACLLLDAGAKDVLNLGLLRLAADEGHLEMIRLLLALRANIEDHDDWRQGPLHRAAKKGHVEAVQLLLNAGADREATDRQGKTPHDLSLHHSHTAVAELLRGTSEAKKRRLVQGRVVSPGFRAPGGTGLFQRRARLHFYRPSKDCLLKSKLHSMVDRDENRGAC